SNAMTSAVLVFDDEASTSLSDNGPISSASYRPTGPGSLSVFDGTDPNGFWRLTISNGSDVATFGNGWQLILETAIHPPDTVPPVLPTLADLTLEATGPAGAVANYGGKARDAMDGEVPLVFDVPPGSTFALGTHAVHYSATDKAGNSSTGSFT